MNNRERVEKYLNTIRSEVLCLYGSYYYGNWRERLSDVDLIIIVKRQNTRRHVKRVVGSIDINIVYISMDILEDDALNGTYGFLYISKFINPHQFIRDSLNYKERIYSLVTSFLEQYAFPEIFSDTHPLLVEEIIARIYLIHLTNFPHYASKLLNTFATHDFGHLREQFTNFIRTSDLVDIVKDKYSIKKYPIHSYRPYFHERMRMRWWQTFQNYRSKKNFLYKQIEKPREIIESNDKNILNLINFLSKTAAYESIKNAGNT